jgi:hypothetical protein
MTNFNQDDLFNYAKNSGFEEIQLTFNAYRRRVRAPGWDYFLKAAPNPNAPSLEEVLNVALSEEERVAFKEFMKPKVENGGAQQYYGEVYLFAKKM